MMKSFSSSVIYQLLNCQTKDFFSLMGERAIPLDWDSHCLLIYIDYIDDLEYSWINVLKKIITVLMLKL